MGNWTTKITVKYSLLNLSRMANGAYHAALWRRGKKVLPFALMVKDMFVKYSADEPAMLPLIRDFLQLRDWLRTGGALCDRPQHYLKPFGSWVYRRGAADPAVSLNQYVIACAVFQPDSGATDDLRGDPADASWPPWR